MRCRLGSFDNTSISAQVRHIIDHYVKGFPDLVFFAHESVPLESRAFDSRGKGSIRAALQAIRTPRPSFVTASPFLPPVLPPSPAAAAAAAAAAATTSIAITTISSSPPASKRFPCTPPLFSRQESEDFGMWGDHVVEMPPSLLSSFCDKIWPLIPHPKPRKRGCPDRVVTMSTPIIYVSRWRIPRRMPQACNRRRTRVPLRRQEILRVPYASWLKLLEILDDDDDKLLLFSFHMLFAQPAVLPQRLMRLH